MRIIKNLFKKSIPHLPAPINHNKSMDYISPRLKYFSTVEDLLNYKGFDFRSKLNYQFEKLNNEDKVLLISEPGHGKTRLLKETIISANKPSIFIDLKKLGREDIETFIEKREKNFKYPTGNIYDAKLVKSETFKLDKNTKQLYCFDALDEVENIPIVIENITNFMSIYDKSSFIISCRKNYLKKWNTMFQSENFKYVMISEFETEDI